jgi:hypothetical protein
MNKKQTIVLIIVIVVALVAYVAFRPKTVLPSPMTPSWDSPEAIKQAQFDSTDLGTVTPLANNQTLYTNSANGFQVTYPSNWVVDKELDGRNSFAIVEGKPPYAVVNAKITIGVQPDNCGSNFDRCIQVGPGDHIETVPFTIDGVTVQAWEQEPGTSYSFFYNGKMYGINFQSSDNTKSPDYSDFQKVLTSFKFL